ncbi:MAG TPA: ROK family transcriptional regulator [Lapillicoccus sp.]|jgi:predicted NBD/HSP70 family sugar kinase|uniref:ROK family transcriptional regulator n=1 Tax=Lapillicoccus sp. TaxID=1909287 RepID=UPI002F926BCC
MTSTKPSLQLLSSLTDEHVLRALMAHERLTRAELATETGISRPTISESVRRLDAAHLVRDTGARTTGRGRVGSYYALAPDLGGALVVGIAPEGVVAEVVDVRGAVVGRSVRPVPHTTRSGRVRRALDAAVAEARDESTVPVVLSVVSAADPVDRESGRLIHLPDAPFLVGDLDPVSVLRPHVSGPVIVDNDVNWAARAESASAGPGELDDFAYVHLGEGLGCAVVSDGEVRRGHHGLTGEITHVLTTGPGGRSVPLTDVFELVGMRTAGTSAVDVSALLSRVDTGGASARRLCEILGAAVSGVLAAVVAFADPRVIVVGGGWGTHPQVLSAVEKSFARLPRRAPVRAARVTDEPALAGARRQALLGLQDQVVARVHDVAG